jgi:predicted nucleic-acid-binding protein
MVGIDTNVLVRVLVDDHPEQCAAARRLWLTNQIWIAKTVLLETEWVLRSAVGASREEILRAFQLLLADPRVVIEDRATVERAVDGFKAGMDLADALHLASRGTSERFVTFDRRLVAASDPKGPRVELLA